MIRKTVIAASILLTTFSTSAHAEFRLATIDINRVVNSSPEAKAEKTALEASTEKAKKLIDQKREALKPLQEKAKKGAITKNSKEGEQLKKLTQELVELMRQKEDELQKQFGSSNKVLTEKALKAVSSYAKDNGIQMVLDRNDAIRSAVLYGDTSFDITDKIIALINK